VAATLSLNNAIAVHCGWGIAARCQKHHWTPWQLQNLLFTTMGLWGG